MDLKLLNEYMNKWALKEMNGPKINEWVSHVNAKKKFDYERKMVNRPLFYLNHGLIKK